MIKGQPLEILKKGNKSEAGTPVPFQGRYTTNYGVIDTTWRPIPSNTL